MVSFSFPILTMNRYSIFNYSEQGSYELSNLEIKEFEAQDCFLVYQKYKKINSISMRITSDSYHSTTFLSGLNSSPVVSCLNPIK